MPWRLIWNLNLDLVQNNLKMFLTMLCLNISIAQNLFSEIVFLQKKHIITNPVYNTEELSFSSTFSVNKFA